MLPEAAEGFKHGTAAETGQQFELPPERQSFASEAQLLAPFVPETHGEGCTCSHCQMTHQEANDFCDTLFAELEAEREQVQTPSLARSPEDTSFSRTESLFAQAAEKPHAHGEGCTCSHCQMTHQEANDFCDTLFAELEATTEQPTPLQPEALVDTSRSQQIADRLFDFDAAANAARSLHEYDAPSSTDLAEIDVATTETTRLPSPKTYPDAIDADPVYERDIPLPKTVVSVPILEGVVPIPDDIEATIEVPATPPERLSIPDSAPIERIAESLDMPTIEKPATDVGHNIDDARAITKTPLVEVAVVDTTVVAEHGNAPLPLDAHTSGLPTLEQHQPTLDLLDIPGPQPHETDERPVMVDTVAAVPIEQLDIMPAIVEYENPGEPAKLLIDVIEQTSQTQPERAGQARALLQELETIAHVFEDDIEAAERYSAGLQRLAELLQISPQAVHSALGVRQEQLRPVQVLLPYDLKRDEFRRESIRVILQNASTATTTVLTRKIGGFLLALINRLQPLAS